MCSSLFWCSTINKLSILHAEECAAMSRNVVKDWPTPTVLTVCLCGRPVKYVKLYMLRVRRTVMGDGEGKTCSKVECRSAVFICLFVFAVLFFCVKKKNFLVNLLSDQLAQSTGAVDAPYLFVFLKVSSGKNKNKK